MTTEFNLLPCPFCNGKPYFERVGTPRVSCIIECGSCGCRLETSEEGGMCGQQWNERAESEPSKSEPVTYGDRLGTYYASVHIAPKSALPQWMQHMTPLYSAPPSAQTGAQDHIAQASKMVMQSTYPHDVSKSAGEIDMAQEREAFEKWVRDSGRGFMLKRHDKNDNWYEDLSVTSWWTAWQARATLAALAQLSDEEIDVQAVRSTKHIGGNLSNSVPFVQVRDFARHLVRALLSAAQGKESE